MRDAATATSRASIASEDGFRSTAPVLALVGDVEGLESVEEGSSSSELGGPRADPLGSAAESETDSVGSVVEVVSGSSSEVGWGGVSLDCGASCEEGSSESVSSSFIKGEEDESK